jgi:hypothetical protein
MWRACSRVVENLHGIVSRNPQRVLLSLTFNLLLLSLFLQGSESRKHAPSQYIRSNCLKSICGQSIVDNAQSRSFLGRSDICPAFYLATMLPLHIPRQLFYFSPEGFFAWERVKISW